ncbi:F-box/LRR-repeat protein 6 isoform X2 [Oryctolagus cuniculus]|uniref:F-box/LRR-repeat protein 6 isoform X2 n=1 Tax=Oryctolagus cuniculus TaxID=9986 RepID=UPI003879ECA3
MAPGAARRARRRARCARGAWARARSAEDWWWDRLAPRGSECHLLQADSMLLVLPGPGPREAAAHPRARPRPEPQPAPAPGPDLGWGDRIPLEILVQVFGLLVAADGPLPFLGRAARVCRRWHEAASHPALWRAVTLAPPLAGRPAKSGVKAEKKLLASLEWLMPSRFSQLQRLTLIHWKSQVQPVLKLVGEHCPRLTFLKLSDCHGVTADALVTLARACHQLHSLDLQHSVVESAAVVSFLEEAGPRMRRLWLTYSSQTTAILGALLGSCCPQLQVLEVSTGISPNSTPLQLPVEALQTGCPQLQPRPACSLDPAPGAPAAESRVAAQALCAGGGPRARLPWPGGALPGQLHLQLREQRGLGPPAPWLPQPAPAGPPRLCPNHACGPARPAVSGAGAAAPGPVWPVRPADPSQGGQPPADPQVVPHPAGAGLERPGIQREGPGAGPSCLLGHPWGPTPGPVFSQPQGHPGHSQHSQRCHHQLPGSAVPEPGVLPLPPQGPEAGLPRPGGSPVVSGAAAHQHPAPQLGTAPFPVLLQ